MSDERPLPSACVPGPEGACAVCADDAVRVRVLSVDARARTAAVDGPAFSGTVALDLVDDVLAGDTILVHQGFAIARLESA